MWTDLLVITSEVCYLGFVQCNELIRWSLIWEYSRHSSNSSLSSSFRNIFPSNLVSAAFQSVGLTSVWWNFWFYVMCDFIRWFWAFLLLHSMPLVTRLKILPARPTWPPTLWKRYQVQDVIPSENFFLKVQIVFYKKNVFNFTFV